jgi:hypothetical protein
VSGEEFPELEELKERLGIPSSRKTRAQARLVSKILSEMSGKDFVDEMSKELGVDVRGILRTADFYRKKSMLENYLLSTIKVRDILSEGSGQALYPGSEIYPEDLGLGAVASVGELKAVVQHISWVTDGKNRALIVVVSFEHNGRVLDETVLTGKSVEDIKASIRTILARLANRLAGGETQ